MEDEKQKIFLELRSILSSHVPPLVVTMDEEGSYEVSGDKKVKRGKKEIDNMFFASTIVQKRHVGFYFFPIYTHREEFDDVPENLMKLLKGKSCFHIKKYDESVFEQIGSMLEKGLEIYKKEGWV